MYRALEISLRRLPPPDLDERSLALEHLFADSQERALANAMASQKFSAIKCPRVRMLGSFKEDLRCFRVL